MNEPRACCLQKPPDLQAKRDSICIFKEGEPFCREDLLMGWYEEQRVGSGHLVSSGVCSAAMASSAA